MRYLTFYAAKIPMSIGWWIDVQFGGNVISFTCPRTSFMSVPSGPQLSINRTRGWDVNLRTNGRKLSRNHCRNVTESYQAFHWCEYGTGGDPRRKHLVFLAVQIMAIGNFAEPFAFLQTYAVTRSFAFIALAPRTVLRDYSSLKYILRGTCLQKIHVSSTLKMQCISWFRSSSLRSLISCAIFSADALPASPDR